MKYDKYDLIEQIILELKATTGINFQYKVKEILVKYYKIKKMKYVMPRHYGGDKKNDGWVVDSDLYYQIYSPVQIKKEISLKKEILSKLTDDLGGLLKHLYEDEIWGGRIEKYIFIINTIDTPLPEDSSNEYEKIAQVYRRKYNIDFKLEVVNTDYLKELLEEIQKIDDLCAIASYLRVKHLIYSDICSAPNIYEVICKISGKMNEDFYLGKQSKEYYKRISSENKININNLQNKKERIEIIISNLDVVERAINLINEDLDDVNKFDKAKDYIIYKYEEMKKNYSGEELYDKIIDESFLFINCKGDFLVAIEYFIVYIFDKCDIFEKEEKK